MAPTFRVAKLSPFRPWIRGIDWKGILPGAYSAVYLVMGKLSHAKSSLWQSVKLWTGRGLGECPTTQTWKQKNEGWMTTDDFFASILKVEVSWRDNEILSVLLPFWTCLLLQFWPSLCFCGFCEEVCQKSGDSVAAAKPSNVVSLLCSPDWAPEVSPTLWISAGSSPSAGALWFAITYIFTQ